MLLDCGRHFMDKEFVKRYIDLLASGAVICGGSTLLDGMPELAERILGIPVRRAAPIGVGGLADRRP